MTLYTFLLVFVSLLSGATSSRAASSPRALFASVLLVGGWVLVSHVAAVWMARRVVGGSQLRAPAALQLRALMDAVRWLAIPITLLCHFGFSLAAWFSIQPVLEHSMTLQAGGLLAPGMTLLVATWSAEFWFHAMVGTRSRPWCDYADSMIANLRGGPAWLIAPTFAFLALGDVAEFVRVTCLGSAALSTNQSDGLMWGLVAGGGLVLCAALPWLVRWIARTESISQSDHDEIETWLHGCDISTHPLWGMQIARWDTGHRVLNAMVAGVIRPGRLLLVSDRLLDDLPRSSRLMVVMHEVAHVKRFHLPIRMAAILPAWLVSSAASGLIVDSGLLEDSLAMGFGGVLGLITTVVTLGVVSHLSELDADAVACRLAVQACQGQATSSLLGSRRTAEEAPRTSSGEMTEPLAAELLADALVRVTSDDPSSRRFSWLHPSLATRVARLRRIARPLPDFTSDSHTLVV